MDINSISGVLAYEKTTTSSKEEKLSVTGNGFSYEAKESSSTTETLAAVFEKTDNGDNSKVVKRDAETIKKMTDELAQKKQQLQNLVETMLHKQGKAYMKAGSIWEALRKGEIEVDPETAKQAQEDIAEDGYWGVEQTSDRLVSFAKALSGGNAEYADKLIDAVKKGFEQATKAWGDKLPDISQKTLDATISKLEKWRDGTEE